MPQQSTKEPQVIYTIDMVQNFAETSYLDKLKLDPGNKMWKNQSALLLGCITQREQAEK